MYPFKEPSNAYFSTIIHIDFLVKYKYDYLTGLPLRMDFESLFETFMQDCNMFQKTFVLAIVDINNLHNINHDEGYLIGDSVILSVSQSLSHILHDSNIYRIGGDEFAILSRTETVDSLYAKLENSKITADITTGAAHSYGTNDCSVLFANVDKTMKEKKSKRPEIKRK